MPVVVSTTVLGVLAATRDPNGEPFGEEALGLLQSLAAEAAPFVRHRLVEKELDEAIATADGPRTAGGEPLYRREALQAYLQGPGGPGRVLELSARRIGRDRGEKRRSPFRWRQRRIPFLQQTTKADCGPACLGMVLAYHGKEVPLRDVREVVGGARDGADAHQLLAGAESYGLRARAVKVDEIESLEYLPPGSILHWQFRHFVVLEHTTKEGAWIVDPAAGPRLVGWPELRTAFTGIAITLEPSESFTPGRAGRGGTRRYIRQLLR